MIMAVRALLWREVIRFLRQPNRIVGALGTPLVFWLLIGSGVGRSFRMPGSGMFGGEGVSYLQYFFPGAILLTLLFTAIFSTISIIEDRREGFLQAVLVAPVGRASIVWGKLLGGALLAFGQGLLFLALMPLVGISVGFGDFLLICAVLALMSFGLTGLGFLLAWRMDSSQGFHAVMNLFLMPLWFLSGAMFPPGGAPAWLAFVMKLNPLTYAIAALHRGLYRGFGVSLASYPSEGVCLAVNALFAAAMLALALREAGRTE